MAEVSELVIQIRATAEGLETTIRDASRLVQKFVREAEKATSEPLKVEVETDSIREAIPKIIEMGKTTTGVAKLVQGAGMLMKGALMDIGISLAAAALSWLINGIIQGLDDLIHARSGRKSSSGTDLYSNEGIEASKKETENYVDQAKNPHFGRGICRERLTGGQSEVSELQKG